MICFNQCPITSKSGFYSFSSLVAFMSTPRSMCSQHWRLHAPLCALHLPHFGQSWDTALEATSRPLPSVFTTGFGRVTALCQNCLPPIAISVMSCLGMDPVIDQQLTRSIMSELTCLCNGILQMSCPASLSTLKLNMVWLHYYCD